MPQEKPYSGTPDGAPRVTVIIPTLCERSRHKLLTRAITSIRSASKLAVHIIVVINGNRFDPNMVTLLHSRGDIEVIQLTYGSLCEARFIGRKRVSTEFFSYLDDDDEYLPDALDIRAALLDADPESSVAITQGYAEINNVDYPLYKHLLLIQEDPLGALLLQNWLASCNHLFRTSDIGEKFFEDIGNYSEWTWLAFTLVRAGRKVAVDYQPTFRYHDTAGSASKSLRQTEAYVKVLQRIRRSGVRTPTHRAMINKRLSHAHHDYSEALLRENLKMPALYHHAASLLGPRGWRFLPYLRHFLFSTTRKASALTTRP